MWKVFLQETEKRHQHKFQDVAVPHTETIHRIVNINEERQGHYWAKIPNQNTECSLMKNWMKSVLGLNMLLRKTSDSLHRRPGFKNCQSKLPQNS
jgi:hypothetical protein